jgi:creatinine amidohydrolase
MVMEIASEIARHGCRALFMLDTGISTRACVERALTRLDTGNALHLKIHDGPCYRRVAAALARQGHGSHADELETSLMLAIAPEIVEMSRAEASPAIAQVVPGRLTRSDKTSPNYSRSGSFGNPTLATLEKGEALLAAMLDDLAEQTKSFLTKLSSTTGRARGAAS